MLIKIKTKKQKKIKKIKIAIKNNLRIKPINKKQKKYKIKKQNNMIPMIIINIKK